MRKQKLQPKLQRRERAGAENFAMSVKTWNNLDDVKFNYKVNACRQQELGSCFHSNYFQILKQGFGAGAVLAARAEIISAREQKAVREQNNFYFCSLDPRARTYSLVTITKMTRL